MKMMRAWISAFALLGALQAGAQCVVVNEFRNMTPDAVELVVVATNLNMQGFIIKDFSSSGNNDSGRAYTFSSDSLWSSLPAGTIIVLRNDTTAADVSVGGSDYNLDVGLQNATYFSSGAGTFDIATDEIIMVKTNGSATAGIVGSIHAFGTDGGGGGTNFAAIATPKLRTLSGDTGGGESVEANNSTSALSDFDGTDASGDDVTGSIGTWNSAANQTFIEGLRGGPAAPVTNVQFTAASATAGEGSTSYTITVYKTVADGNVTGEVAVSGTATNGLADDYTIDTTNFTLNGATTAATFVVTINDDALVEVNETVILTLANVTGGGTATPSAFTLTIQDNDSSSSSSVIISQYTETDTGTTPKGIEVWNVSGSDITFDSGGNLLAVLIGVNGAAMATVTTVSAGTLVDGDVWVIGTSDMTPDTTFGFTYNGDDAVAVALGGVLQDVVGEPGVDPGAAWTGGGLSTANQNIQLKSGITTGDVNGWTDPSERFELVGVGSTLTGFGTAPGSSPPTNVTFTAASASTGEGAGTYNVTIIKSLSSGSVTGEVTLGGTATVGGGNDYTLSTTNFALDGATTSATITVTLNDDASVEGIETLILTLANVTGGTIASPSVFTLTILDNDPPASATASVWINEVDYDSVGSDTNEWVEIAGLAGLSLNDYELIMIADNGTTNNVFDLAGASWTFADETSGYGFCVIGIVTPGEGTADFTPSGWDSGELQNGPGDSLQLRQKTGSLNVHLIDYAGDNLYTVENQQTVVGDTAAAFGSIFLTGGPGTNFNSFSWTNTASSATPGAANSNQTFAAGGPVTTVQFTASAATVGEEVGTYNVLVYKSNADGNLIGEVALSGTATVGGGNDYTMSTTNFALNGATTSATLTITINDDASVESTETVILTLANVAGGTLGSPSVFTLSITNNDIPPAPSSNVWINEMHYDNAGGDVDEGFEIAGPAGTDLSSYLLSLYEGLDGSVYSNRTLSGTIPNESNNYGAVWFDFSNGSGTGVQNGSPDGVALSVVQGGVTSLIQFLTYEGSFVGAAGPANGVTSTDIGVAESGATLAGDALQVCGTGTNASDFTWNAASAHSRGLLNACQNITGGGDPNDQDGDGLPDDWELLLFGTSTNEPGGDVDQDGFPNGDEFVAFTDPTNSASYFRATGVTNAGGAYVVVPSVTGRQYRLYGSELLGGQSWTNLVAGPVAGTGGNISLSAGTSQTSAAVRLEVDLP